MRIAIILLLASLGPLIAVALYVLAMRGRSRRTILSDHEKELAESEAPTAVEPEQSVQIEEPKPVSLEPKTSGVEVEIRMEGSLDQFQSTYRQLGPTPSTVNTGAIQPCEDRPSQAES